MEPTKFCSNCEENIPESKFVLHERFCASNVKKCQICKEIINIEDEQEHIKEYHTKAECIHCKKGFEKDRIENHQANCDEQLVKCQYCSLDISKRERKNHEYSCGAKTEPCHTCNEYIQMKDYDMHIAIGCKSKQVKTEYVAPKGVNKPKENTDIYRDKERLIEKEREKEREKQFEFEKQLEKNRERQIEKERERQKEKEKIEIEKQIEFEKQLKKNRERQIEKERERQKEKEKENQKIKVQEKEIPLIQSNEQYVFDNNHDYAINEIDWSIYSNDYEKQKPQTNMKQDPQPLSINPSNKPTDNKKRKSNQTTNKANNYNQAQGQVLERTKQILEQKKNKQIENKDQYKNNKRNSKNDQKLIEKNQPIGINAQISNDNPKKDKREKESNYQMPLNSNSSNKNANIKYPEYPDKRIEKHDKIIDKYQNNQSDQKGNDYKKQIPVKEDKREIDKPKLNYNYNYNNEINQNPINSSNNNSNNQKVNKPLSKENLKPNYPLKESKANPIIKPNNNQGDYQSKFLDDYLPDDVTDFTTKENFYPHINNPTDEDVDLNEAIQQSFKFK